jgi:hypothetical protein
VVQKLARPGGILLVTRGDRQRTADLPVSATELLGRVTGILRRNHRKVQRLTVGRWVAAWVLSRSEFLTRVLLYLSNRLPWRSRPREAQWAS